MKIEILGREKKKLIKLSLFNQKKKKRESLSAKVREQIKTFDGTTKTLWGNVANIFGKSIKDNIVRIDRRDSQRFDCK